MVGCLPPAPLSDTRFTVGSPFRTSSFCPFYQLYDETVSLSGPAPGYLPTSETGEKEASGLSGRECPTVKRVRTLGMGPYCK